MIDDDDFDDWGLGGVPDFSDDHKANNDIARDLHEWRSSGGLLSGDATETDQFDPDAVAF